MMLEKKRRGKGVACRKRRTDRAVCCVCEMIKEWATFCNPIANKGSVVTYRDSSHDISRLRDLDYKR